MGYIVFAQNPGGARILRVKAARLRDPRPLDVFGSYPIHIRICPAHGGRLEGLQETGIGKEIKEETRELFLRACTIGGGGPREVTKPCGQAAYQIRQGYGGDASQAVQGYGGRQ